MPLLQALLFGYVLVTTIVMLVVGQVVLEAYKEASKSDRLKVPAWKRLIYLVAVSAMWGPIAIITAIVMIQEHFGNAKKER